MGDTRSAPPIGPSRDTGLGKAKFKRHVSPEARQRLSELAKARHASSEGHGFSRGMVKPGTKREKRPSKRRVAALVAEAAREEKNAQDIIDVFKDGISSTQPMHIRLKAAEAWLKVERDDAAMALREADSESQKHDRGELLSILSEKLSEAHMAGLLRRQLEQETGIIDADVIEGDEVIEG